MKNSFKNEIELLKLNHKFALNMATLLSWAVVSIVLLVTFFFGAKTILAIVSGIVIAILFGIITACVTRNSCL